jgi:hypothetical protein
MKKIGPPKYGNEKVKSTHYGEKLCHSEFSKENEVFKPNFFQLGKTWEYLRDFIAELGSCEHV